MKKNAKVQVQVPVDEKIELTTLIGKHLGWSYAEQAERFGYIWQNTRKGNVKGLRLTDEGLRILSEEMDIKSYRIALPENIMLTNQTMIWLGRFIDGPYHINKEEIIVFREKPALQLILFDGDVQKLITAKLANKEIEARKNEMIV